MPPLTEEVLVFTLPDATRTGIRIRRGARSARRFVLGSRGLGAGVAARWLWQRGARPEPSTQNSAFAWVVANERRTTVAWFHNYWSDTYGIPRPTLAFALLDQEGAARHTWTETLEPDATIAIDVREVCRDTDIPLPFEGQLLTRLDDDRLVPGRPVQCLVDYIDDEGNATGVHGQYGLMRNPLAQTVSGMRVESGPGVRTAVVVTNPYDGPGSPAGLVARVTVLNGKGGKRSRHVGPISPRGARRVWLDELFPGLPTFLEGQAGHVAVRLPCPSSRLATVLEYDDGRWITNHGTVDRVFDQGRGVPETWRSTFPVVSALVRCDHRRDTVLTFPNRLGPASSRYDVLVKIYAQHGALLAEGAVPIPPNGVARLSARELLTSRGIGLPMVAGAEVTVRPVVRMAETPAVLDLLVGLTEDDRLLGEVQVGSDFFNADVPPGLRVPDVRRTRTFGRVLVGAGRRSWIFLANPAGRDPYDGVAHPSVTLLDRSGVEQAVVDLELPPHGSVLLDVADAFPDATKMLGTTGSGIVRVRDTTARVYGFSFVETAGSTTIPIDHLVGG